MYDALTADRVYKAGMSSKKAFAVLMNESPVRLDKYYVQQFIKCLGVYPVGSLVMLSNERLAMVLQQNDSPFMPVVKVFYSVKQGHYLTPKDVDLSQEKTVTVTKAVIASEYNIDINAFFERSVSIG